MLRRGFEHLELNSKLYVSIIWAIVSNLEFWGFSKKLFFFGNLKLNWGCLGISGRCAPAVRCYLENFSRFGGIWGRKVQFSTFSGKLTFQCSRNGPQNPPFCPGSFQDTIIIYSSISHQHIFQKYFPRKRNLENRKSENLKFQKTQVTNKCPAWPGSAGTLLPWPVTLFPGFRRHFFALFYCICSYIASF